VTNRIRIALLVVGAAVFIAGAYASQGPPRLTLLNAGLSVQHPWRHPVGAVIAAGGAALLAAASPRRWSRLIFHALAALSLVVAIHLVAYRVDADQSGLASRGLLGRTRIPWPEVAGVDGDASQVVVTGKSQNKIRVDTTDFRPDQRATLDRTIARRVRESSPTKD
jgi:PH (Pleckstrin Homology) domain-containing protein